MVDIDKTILAWTAGLLDGEGCIVIAKANKKLKNPHYKMNVQIAMCYRPAIERLYMLYGGSVSHRVGKDNNRDSWTWSICNNHAAEFLTQLLPYLVVKQAEAKLAIEFQHSIANNPRVGARGLSVETLVYREDMYQQCKKLKKLAWGNDRF